MLNRHAIFHLTKCQIYLTNFDALGSLSDICVCVVLIDNQQRLRTVSEVLPGQVTNCILM